MKRLNRQTGVTLVELMVTLVIASLLILALVAVFLSSRTSFLTQEQLARLQENGRYAFESITRELKEAGFRRETWEPPALGFPLVTANAADGGAVTADGGGANADTLVIHYESDKDCLDDFNAVTENVAVPGGGTATVPQYYHKLLRYTIVNNQLNLECRYGPVNGVLAQQINGPIADGVENLQVQYGEDLNGDLSVNQWVNAGGWSNAFDVVAVRIGLVVRTPETFTTEADTQTFDLYGTTTTAQNDQRIRRVYAGEVNMRNLTL